MILLDKRIDCKRGDHFHIIPIGDVHYGTGNCDEKKLIETVNWITSKNNVYWLGMGDYIEAINLTDKRFDPNNISKKFITTDLDKLVKKQIDGITKILEPIKDKCLGLLEGNHEEHVRLTYHQSVVDILAYNLTTQNLSYCSILTLRFVRSGKGVKAVTIWAHHGYGGGRQVGGNINALINKSHEFDCDIYVMGHVHKKLVHSVPILYVSANKLQEKKKLFGITGTFYKTYETGIKSYSEKAGYSPTETGVINIRIEPHRRGGMMDNQAPHLHISA